MRVREKTKRANGLTPSWGRRLWGPALAAAALLWLMLLVGRARAREVLPGLEVLREPAPAVAEPLPRPPTERPQAVVLEARELITWSEGTWRVFVAHDQVELRHDSKTVTAQRAVVWFDEARPKLTGVIALDVYVEGEVRLTERGTTISSEQEFFHLETLRRFLVRDADGTVQEHPGPVLSDLLQRARTARRTEGVIPRPPPRPALPRYPVPEPARRQLLEARYQAYALNTKGFDTQSWVDEDGRRVFVITGGVDILRDVPARAGAPAETIELMADSIVTWVPLGEEVPAAGGALRAELYAEGNVTLYTRGRVLECDRLFYDLTDDRAIILDALIRSTVRAGQLPLYYRAKEVRQLNRTQYVAYDAIISTCEFEHPHYWLQARQLSLDESEDQRLAVALDSVFFVHGLPLWYWPYYARDLERDRTVLKRLRLRHSSEFGTELRTAWDLYDLGLYDNDWSNLALVVDVLTERGVGLGLDFDYDRWGGKGYFTSYYIDDSGEDFPDVPLLHRERGRFEWRHRQRLSPYDTLLAEFAWMSDRNFLDEYFEREAREDKEKETILYYKHQRGLAAFTALAKVRTNNFLTQTEYLPQVGFRLLGYPLGYSVWGDRLTLTSTSQLANVRLRPDDALHLPQPRAWRFDTLNELAMPLAWRFIHFVPFVAARYTAYSDSPDALGRESGDSQDRFAAAVGFRSSATFWRVYRVSSRLWDLDSIRHIVTPTVDFLHRFAVSAEPHELFQFDEVDSTNEFQVISLGLRQRWQTRRLSRGYSPLASVDQRVVDWLVLDAELDVFPNRARDNAGDLFGNMELDLIWRVSDHVAVLSDAELDLDDGFGWDRFNVALKVDRSPRLSFYLGHRYIRDVASSAFTAGFDYQVSQKWQLGALWQYDLQADAVLTQRIVLTRRLHRWLLEISFERDEGEEEGEGDTSVGLTLIPQGLPETKLRFF